MGCVALGAGRVEMVRLVMRDGVLLAAMGVAAGIPLVLASSGILGTLLFGVTGADPLIIAASGLFFLALGIAAGIIPARRAASVDPLTALRQD